MNHNEDTAGYSAFLSGLTLLNVIVTLALALPAAASVTANIATCNFLIFFGFIDLLLITNFYTVRFLRKIRKVLAANGSSSSAPAITVGDSGTGAGP